MTRAQFDTIFLEQYDTLVRWASARIGGEGRDVLHQCYANILIHKTYTTGPYKYANRWIHFKLAREMVRYRKAKRIRDQRTWEGQHVLVEAMQERERLERPDSGLELRALPMEKESCN